MSKILLQVDVDKDSLLAKIEKLEHKSWELNNEIRRLKDDIVVKEEPTRLAESAVDI